MSATPSNSMSCWGGCPPIPLALPFSHLSVVYGSGQCFCTSAADLVPPVVLTQQQNGGDGWVCLLPSHAELLLRPSGCCRSHLLARCDSRPGCVSRSPALDAVETSVPFCDHQESCPTLLPVIQQHKLRCWMFRRCTLRKPSTHVPLHAAQAHSGAPQYRFAKQLLNGVFTGFRGHDSSADIPIAG